MRAPTSHLPALPAHKNGPRSRPPISDILHATARRNPSILVCHAAAVLQGLRQEPQAVITATHSSLRLATAFKEAGRQEQFWRGSTQQHQRGGTFYEMDMEEHAIQQQRPHQSQLFVAQPNSWREAMETTSTQCCRPDVG